MSKYGNVKTEIDGIKFDSKKEARRYGELRLFEKAGEITNLTVHPKFVLQEGFIWHRKKIRPITYSADFMYQENGQIIVEDVKGVQTQLFRVKAKMFKRKYPELVFRIVEE